MHGRRARSQTDGGARAQDDALPPFAFADDDELRLSMDDAPARDGVPPAARAGALCASGGGACECAEAAAYLDGELRAAEAESFESHLKSCAACAAALTEQRRLLGLLDAAFGGGRRDRVELPADFTRVVKARAQSDMTRVRRASEKGRALALSAALAALAFALLGAQFWAEVLSFVRPAADAASALSEITLRASSSAASGTGVLLRGFGGYLLHSGRAGANLFVYAALACALLLLLGLIGKYHRAGLPD